MDIELNEYIISRLLTVKHGKSRSGSVNAATFSSIPLPSPASHVAVGRRGCPEAASLAQMVFFLAGGRGISTADGQPNGFVPSVQVQSLIQAAVFAEPLDERHAT